MDPSPPQPAARLPFNHRGQIHPCQGCCHEHASDLAAAPCLGLVGSRDSSAPDTLPEVQPIPFHHLMGLQLSLMSSKCLQTGLGPARDEAVQFPSAAVPFVCWERAASTAMRRKSVSHRLCFRQSICSRAQRSATHLVSIQINDGGFGHPLYSFKQELDVGGKKRWRKF